jgi:hypothetical protein
MKRLTLTPARPREVARRPSLLLRALSGDIDAGIAWLEKHGHSAPPELRIAVFRATAPRPAVTVRLIE